MNRDLTWEILSEYCSLDQVVFSRRLNKLSFESDEKKRLVKATLFRGLFQNIIFLPRRKPTLPDGCGWHPRKVRTAKYLASAALEYAGKKYFEVGFVGAFFWWLFWACKKVTKRLSVGLDLIRRMGCLRQTKPVLKPEPNSRLKKCGLFSIGKFRLPTYFCQWWKWLCFESALP